MNKNSIRNEHLTVSLLTEQHGFLIDRNIKKSRFQKLGKMFLEW